MLYFAPMIIVDYEALAAHYSQMTEEDFALIKREELTQEARTHYDREMARRIPGWHYHYEEPTPELKLQKFMQLQKKVKRQSRIQSLGLMTIVLALLILSLRVPVEFSTVRFYLIGSANLLVMLAGFQQIVSIYRTGYVVLWLRRFHRRRQKPFLRALNYACRFVGMPLTIQDSSFRFSMGFAMGRLVPYAGFFFVLFFFGGIIAGPILRDMVMLSGCAVIVIAMATSYWWAFFRLRGEKSSQQLLRLLEKVKAGNARSGGTLIVRSQDEFWRNVVELALRHADAVVIDVTEPSENVFWELRTALSLRHPASILLACAVDKTSPNEISSSELPETVRSELQAAFGEAQLSRFSLLFYPARRDISELIKIIFPMFYKSHWLNKLRESLTQCISYAPSHDNS